ncbi:hypothetical protein [Pseudonocardia sp.]|uniref:hypothetical protein n=1 Tax=Pseudonocardia sp. TaxID=60912 RepID=UPI003D13AFC8
MVAVVDGGLSPPDQHWSGPALHRLVAVALRPDELRAGADLVRRLAAAPHVDLLILTDGDDAAGSADDDTDAGVGEDDDLADVALPADLAGVEGPDVGALARERAAALGLRVNVHRLALPAPSDVRPRDVDDVVAAISELVGFDPEPGVGCVVPIGAYEESRLSGAAAGPADVMVGRAVERIVAAYRLPLVTYVPQVF